MNALELEQLSRQHRARAVALLERALGADAEDVVQEAFIELMGCELDEPRAAGAFLGRVAWRCAHRWVRSVPGRREEQFAAAADGRELSELQLEPVPSPEGRVLAREALQELEHQLEAMPERERQVFALAVVDELATTAAAQRLGISTRQAARHLQSARARLGLQGRTNAPRAIVDDLGRIYASQNQAARALGLQVQKICKVLQGNARSTGGRTFHYLDEHHELAA